MTPRTLKENVMSEHIFDALARSTAAAASRRGYARALTGLALGGLWSSLLRLDDVEAKKGRKRRKKKRHKNKKKKNQATTPPPTCTSSCAGKVCGDDGCGGSCGSCGPGELCAQGQCVTGQGTCQTGQDICVDFEHTCGTIGCHCRTSMSNQTRCGQEHEIDDEHFCASDAECALFFPDTPGVFCAQASGQNCPGRVQLCYAPCPL
jgi:hypothetical protein